MQNVHHVRTPKDALTQRLRVLRIAMDAKELFSHMKQLREASEGLAWHLSDRIMFPFPRPFRSDTPLIDCCLRRSFDWLFFNSVEGKTTIREAQTYFLAGLMYDLPELAHVSVQTDREQWDPYHDIALSEWLPRRPGAIIKTRHPDDSDREKNEAGIRAAVLNRMFQGRGFGHLDADLKLVFLPPEDFIPPRS